jgi:hypothetical protein
MAAFDSVLRYGVEHLSAGHDFAAGESADLKLAVGELADALAHLFCRAVDGIEALRPACGHAPAHLAGRLSDGRGRDRAGHHADRGLFQKRTPFHLDAPWMYCRSRA